MRLRISALFLAGAVALAGLGLFMGGQASFADTYVREQLLAERITFATAEELTDEEKTWKPGSTCLVEYAGQPLGSGKQAECYANYYIGLHVANRAKSIGYPGETYGSFLAVQNALKADIAAAHAKNDHAAAAAAQKKLDTINVTKETMFKGEMLRSALLTVYGFSTLGSVAGTAATLSYAGAALLIALAGYAFVRGRARAAAPQPEACGCPAPAATAA